MAEKREYEWGSKEWLSGGDLAKIMDKLTGKKKGKASDEQDDSQNATIPDSINWQRVLIKTGEKDDDLCIHGYRINLSQFSKDQKAALEQKLTQEGIKFSEKKASDKDIVTEDGIQPVKKGDPVLAVEDPQSIVKLKFNVWKQTHMHAVRRADEKVAISEGDFYRVYGVMTTVGEEKRKEMKLSTINDTSLPRTMHGYKLKAPNGR